MPSKVKVTGKPLAIRRETLDNKTIYCLDYVEGGKSIPPKGLPFPTRIPVTILVNEKQWKKLFYKKKLAEISVCIEGEITMDVPQALVKGDFAVAAFSIQNIQKES
jgi:hypothetical protein